MTLSCTRLYHWCVSTRPHGVSLHTDRSDAFKPDKSSLQWQVISLIFQWQARVFQCVVTWRTRELWIDSRQRPHTSSPSRPTRREHSAHRAIFLHWCGDSCHCVNKHWQSGDREFVAIILYLYSKALNWLYKAQWSLYVVLVVTICTTSLTFSNSTFYPHSVFMWFVWIWEQTAIISLYRINCLVCINETVCLLRGMDWIFIYRQFNIQQFYVLSTPCIYVFCVDLRTNSDYFPIQN